MLGFAERQIFLYGCSAKVMTSRGTKLESQLFRDTPLTSSPHLATNWMVKHFRPQLSGLLAAPDRTNWVQALSTVLLRLWCALKRDNETPAT